MKRSLVVVIAFIVSAGILWLMARKVDTGVILLLTIAVGLLILHFLKRRL